MVSEVKRLHDFEVQFRQKTWEKSDSFLAYRPKRAANAKLARVAVSNISSDPDCGPRRQDRKLPDVSVHTFPSLRKARPPICSDLVVSEISVSKVLESQAIAVCCGSLNCVDPMRGLLRIVPA